MAHLPRFFVPGQPLHAIQRGNNRAAIFAAPEDYARFREFLHDGAKRYTCAIHAYVLMTNHFHLLVTPAKADSLSKLCQTVCLNSFSRSAAATCSISISRTRGAGRCGKAGIGQLSSTPNTIF